MLVRFARWAWPGQFSQLELTELDVGEAVAHALITTRSKEELLRVMELGREFADAMR